MKQRLKGLVCWWLAIIMLFGTSVSALAASGTITDYVYYYYDENSPIEINEYYYGYESAEIDELDYGDDSETLLTQLTDIVDSAPEGKELSGWNLWKINDSGCIISGPINKQTEDCVAEEDVEGIDYYKRLIIEPVFNFKTFLVKFVNEGGAELQSDELEYGAMPVYVGATPEKAADAEYTYTFAGWSPAISEVTSEVTYTATYTATPISGAACIVTFDSNGGSDVPATPVISGERLVKPDDPYRSGYSFAGWYNEDFTVEYDFESAVTSDFTLFAKWNKKRSYGGGGGGTTRYTVNFESNNGSEISDKSIVRNGKVPKPKDPIRDGYVFDGWYIDKNFEVLYDFDAMVTKSITLYAKWGKDAVSGLLNTTEHIAYMHGSSDKKVRPNDNILRAEVAAIFFRLLNDETRESNLTQSNGFLDVAVDAWYNEAVSTMAKLGIVKGRTADAFAPDKYITRAELAAICARFDDSDFEVKDSFSDIEGHWAESEIYEAAAHGWVNGYEDGSFRPEEFITRAEVVAMINRMLGRTPTSVEDLHEDMIKWIDNSDESAWYYVDIQEATNSHGYTKADNGNEKWTNVTSN